MLEVQHQELAAQLAPRIDNASGGYHAYQGQYSLIATNTGY